MKKTLETVVIMVTTPNLRVAHLLARTALHARLVACANIVPKVESHYWWRGRLRSSSECLILFKSQHPRLRELERLLIEHHPYDTPELIALPIVGGSRKYMAWLTGELASPDARVEACDSPSSAANSACKVRTSTKGTLCRSNSNFKSSQKKLL